MKHLPNIITGLRLVIVPFFAYYLYQEQFLLAFILFGVAAFSDVLDGYLARKYKVITNFGKICDPLADKTLQLSALIVLFLIGRLKLVFVIILFIKEVLLVIGGIIIYKRKIIVPAQWYGKFASLLLNTSIAITIIFPLKDVYIDILISLSVAAMLFSLVMYLLNYINVCEKREESLVKNDWLYKIFKPELKVKDLTTYESYYCGICKSLKTRYGLFKNMTLNYDCVFISLLIDALNNEQPKSDTFRCAYNPGKRKTRIINNSTNFTADVNIYLSYKKLQDDYKDEKKVISFIGSVLLKRAGKKSGKKLKDLKGIIDNNLYKLYELEKELCSDSNKISNYYGNVVKEICSYQFKNNKSLFKISKYLGYNIGKWVYLIDAFDDLQDDIKHKSYNPYLLEYQYNNEDILEFKNRIKDNVKKQMYEILDEAVKAYELVDENLYTPLIYNILFDGIFNTTNNIIEGNVTMAKDPYSVLGVTTTATDDQIKDAYKKLVKKYHPDKFQETDLKELAEEKLAEVNVAYDTITKNRSNGNTGFNNYQSNNSQQTYQYRRQNPYRQTTNRGSNPDLCNICSCLICSDCCCECCGGDLIACC